MIYGPWRPVVRERSYSGLLLGEQVKKIALPSDKFHQCWSKMKCPCLSLLRRCTCKEGGSFSESASQRGKKERM